MAVALGSTTAYEPTPEEIGDVKSMFMGVGIPIEIIDNFLDYAEYWAHSSSEAHFDDVDISSQEEARFLIRSFPVGLTNLAGAADSLGGNAYQTTPIEPQNLEEACGKAFFENLAQHPTPTLENPVRKVVFRIRSHDQGWGSQGRGTFTHAWTWFDAGIEKFDAKHTCENCSVTLPLQVCKLRSLRPQVCQAIGNNDVRCSYEQPDRSSKWEIQRNMAAQGDWKDYEITWSYTDNIDPSSQAAQELAEEGRGQTSADGEFIRNLELGDVVTVWGRAKYPGWRNHVQSVRIDVYWAV